MDHQDLNTLDPLAAEHAAMDEAETTDHHHPDDADNDAGEALLIEKGTKTEEVLPAELAAVHTDTESAQEASGETNPSDDDVAQDQKVPEKIAKATKTPAQQTGAKARSVKTKKRQRSVRYLEAAKKVDPKRQYEAKDALRLTQETSYTKFDGALEVHCRLKFKKGKSDGSDRFRMMVALPHGTGRELKVGMLDEALIETIKQTGDTNFDILVARPALMPKVAQIAKILGPKGKMPNPKTGTVTDDPEGALRAIASGRVELKADSQGNLHQTIGRISWSLDKLIENFSALLAGLPIHRLQRITVSATMGPGINVQFEK